METLSPSPETQVLPAQEPAAPESAPVDINVIIQESQEVLGQLLKLLSFDAKMTLQVDGQILRIRLSCEDAGRLIGRRGATVNEIQFLLNRILQRRHKMVPRIYLDVEGERERTPVETATPETQGTEAKVTPAATVPAESTPAPTPSIPAPVATVPPTPKPAPVPKPSGQGVSQRVLEMAEQVRRWGEPMKVGLMNSSEREAGFKWFSKDREVELIPENDRMDAQGNQSMKLQIRQK